MQSFKLPEYGTAHGPQLPSSSSTPTSTPPRVSSINFSFNNSQFRALHTRVLAAFYSVLAIPGPGGSRVPAYSHFYGAKTCLVYLPSLQDPAVLLDSSLHAHAGFVSMRIPRDVLLHDAAIHILLRDGLPS